MSIRQYILIVVVLIWIVPSGLGFILLKIQKKAIRSSVKEWIYDHLNDDDITRIAISKKDSKSLIWHHADEFEMNGNMFDVLSVKEINDSLVYFCFWDQKESKVNVKIDLLARVIWARSPFSNDFEGRLIDFIQKVVLSQYDNLSLGGKLKGVELVECVNHINYLEGYLDVFSPPPEIC